MPELPDVEGFRAYVERTSLCQTIERVDVRSPEILDGVSARRLVHTLEGCRLTRTRRYGKYLFVQLESGKWLVYHFGMTGRPVYFKDARDDPPHDRLLISFANGFHLAFDCQRKLGSVSLADSVGGFLRAKKRGPDALELDFRAFRALLSGRRGAVKSALMNQRIVAGIGNVYADEILFQARVHPTTSVNRLREECLRELFDSMNEALTAGIEHAVRSKPFPDSYLLHHRGEGEKCPRCGGKVERLTVSGRTAYYCSKCQAPGADQALRH